MYENEPKTCEEYVLNELYKEQEEHYLADQLLEKAYYEREALKSEVKENNEVFDFILDILLEDYKGENPDKEITSSDLYNILELPDDIKGNPAANLLVEKLISRYSCRGK